MDKRRKWAIIHCPFGVLMKDILVKTVSSIGLRFQTARSLEYQIWSRSRTQIPEAPVKMPLKFPLREEMSAWHWHVIIPPVHGKLGGWFKWKGWGPMFYWALSSLPGHPGISKDQVSHLEPVNSSFFSASVAEVRFTSVLCHSWRQQARLITYRMLAWQDCCLSLGWPGSQRRGGGVGDVGEDHGSPNWSPQPTGQPMTQGEL